MKKHWIVAAILALTMAVSFTPSYAAKRAKFGVDPRHESAEHIKFKTSTEHFHWKMVMPWSKGLLFYDIAVHFCDSVRLASGGRLDIKPFSAGELVPAMQTFDAVSDGSAQVGHDWAGYWKGKNEGFVPLGDIPFGLDSEGYNIWLYQEGGLALAQQLYGKFNLVAFPCGQTGQDMGLFSNKPATKPQDFKGMRVRTVGWYMDILNKLGASVSPLPGGEVYLSLERGVIDAAEFSAPAINWPMGFDEITKYVIEPGVHQPASQCYVFFNKQAYDKLPEDLKQIVQICAKETQLWSYNWIQALDAQAINMFAKKVKIIQMDKATLLEFRKTTHAYVDSLMKKYPEVNKIVSSQRKFRENFVNWRKARGRVAPWPYKIYESGTFTQ